VWNVVHNRRQYDIGHDAFVLDRKVNEFCIRMGEVSHVLFQGRFGAVAIDLGQRDAGGLSTVTESFASRGRRGEGECYVDLLTLRGGEGL
jgi:hypothetical protein